MRFFFLILAFIAITTAYGLSNTGTQFLLKEEWGSFKEKFSKSYPNSAEEEMRFSIFAQNVERAATLNEKHDSTSFGITKFSDLDEQEFKTQYLNYRPSGKKDFEVRDPTVASAPTNYDWRDQSGVMTDVKDQGQCGSCWAFSATETIESAWALAGNSLQELSPQQIVSCDTECYGCGGGWTEKAFDYVMSAGGLASEADYPYVSGTNGVSGTCESFSVSGGVMSGYEYATTPCTSFFCNKQDEDTLASVLAADQPLAICVDASSWSSYTGGVFPSSACSSSYFAQDHCVQLVGYNGYGSSSGYWIVRNSWNTDWGEDGFIYLELGENTCGVANDAVEVMI